MGSGKTSLLNLIAARVEATGTGYVVRFDPWLFSSSEELVLRFLREMAIQLRRKRALGDVASRIESYAQVLAPLTVLTPTPWMGPVLAVFGRLVARLRKKDRSAERQRDEVREALRRLDRRVVVLIDDLDRLQSTEIRDVVRLVKLVGDFPNTTYVLAYDQARVADALGDGNAQLGHEFLEKIVQLSHDVPPVAPELLSRVLAESISGAVGDLSRYRFDEAAYTKVFADGVRPLFATVRDVRRYTNVLPATLELIGDEVELADVLALEALRVRVPASFALITASKQALTDPYDSVPPRTPASDASAREQIVGILAAAGRFGDEIAAIVKRTFPAAARHLGGSSYGSSWLANWRRDLRVAHPEVFDIYVNKALPSGTLPTSLAERAFSSLQDRDALVALFGGLSSDQLETLLDRLEQYEPDFPMEQTEVPVSVLYNQRGRLREEKRHVFDIGAGHKVGRVALRILRKLEPAEVTRVTRAALSDIRTLSDRGELVRLVGFREDSGHQLVTKSDADLLETEFFDDLLATEPALLVGERDLMHLLLRTHANRPADTTELVQQFVESDELLPRLLRAAIYEIVGQTSGDAAVRRSYQLNWPTLTELAPGDRLAERVKQLHASHLLDDADELTTQALEAAVRYADDPAAAEQDVREWPKSDQTPVPQDDSARNAGIAEAAE